MRKLAYIFVILFLHHVSNSQNHVIGMGFGISSFEPPIYLNYQFNYKLLNTKIKASLLPIGLWSSAMSSSYDLYAGIKTKDDKRNVFSLNTGIILFHPKTQDYYTSIKQQVNPIVNFEYAFAFNANNRITADLSISQYNKHVATKFSNYDDISVEYMILEIGYAYKFKKRTKEVKTTN